MASAYCCLSGWDPILLSREVSDGLLENVVPEPVDEPDDLEDESEDDPDPELE